MTLDIPQYGLRAYALFFTRHGSTEEFGQHDLDWIVSQSMKKKIFALLLRSGWIKKSSRRTYTCITPEKALKGLLDFKVPELMKTAKKPYAFTDLSAVEIWSDYSYVQRGLEKSPYFINVLGKDLKYWKSFFSAHGVSFYVDRGSTIGEYVILKPVRHLASVERYGVQVISFAEAQKIAKTNDAYSYAYDYMRQKHGPAAT